MGLGEAAIADADTSMPGLELLVLGSGRAGSSYLVLLNGAPRILVDAGPGSFARVGEAKVSLADTNLVLLTHLHADHAGELPGLFKARAVSGTDSATFNVWGPNGSGAHHQGAYFPATSRFLDLMFGKRGAFAYLDDFAAPITIHAHDIPVQAGSDMHPQVIFRDGDLVISAVPGHHGDAPAVIYRIDFAGKSTRRASRACAASPKAATYSSSIAWSSIRPVRVRSCTRCIRRPTRSARLRRTPACANCC
jgi:glyoxylase-like metal-dependent hydrolase (beta-lactamase superfamily II)